MVNQGLVQGSKTLFIDSKVLVIGMQFDAAESFLGNDADLFLERIGLRVD